MTEYFGSGSFKQRLLDDIDCASDTHGATTLETVKALFEVAEYLLDRVPAEVNERAKKVNVAARVVHHNWRLGTVQAKDMQALGAALEGDSA